MQSLTIDKVKAAVEALKDLSIPMSECLEASDLLREIDSELRILSRFSTPPQGGLDRVWKAVLALLELIQRAVLRLEIARNHALQEAARHDASEAERREVELSDAIERLDEAKKAAAEFYRQLLETPHREPTALEKKLGVR